MKVQTRLSLFSSLVFGVVFIIISVLIYGLYSSNIKKSIYDKLKQSSYVTALFYLEEDELNKDEFAKVRNQFQELVTNPYYQVYDKNDKVSYGTAYMDVSPETLNQIRQEGNVAFSDKNYLCYGIYYEDNQGDFVVIAGENRELLNKQLKTLLWIMVLAFIVGTMAVIILNRWIAYIAYRPFRKVIRQVNNISTQNLNVQIRLPNTQDELQDLITTFNHLLVKLSETFEIQQNFVRYVSHEFKTPLAAMQGNLEVFSIKERSVGEYRKLAQNLLEQINQLEETINTLIVISGSKNVPEEITAVRVDELIWDILQKLSVRYDTSKITVNIDIKPEDESILTVEKNKTQLFMMLFNIIENAAKYSHDESVEIFLFKKNRKLSLSVTDKGIGIPPEQLPDVSKPFYRANNANHVQGSGIGLSIALKIAEKNGIEYQIRSAVNEGTTVELSF